MREKRNRLETLAKTRYIERMGVKRRCDRRATLMKVDLHHCGYLFICGIDDHLETLEHVLLQYAGSLPSSALSLA